MIGMVLMIFTGPMPNGLNLPRTGDVLTAMDLDETGSGSAPVKRMGVAGYWTLYSIIGARLRQGTCSMRGDGGDMELDNTSLGPGMRIDVARNPLFAV